ncbi:unnamed protein product [Amoebophrya sp. A120]|nr:unnamed protein product [Amoebophrya sp. A120]|eukprot:GSA120T00006488001.1
MTASSEVSEQQKMLEANAGKEGARTRVLITGGAGFIGSHLLDYLMERGYDCIVCDNFFTGKKDNVARWMGHPNFEMIRHDIVEHLMVEVDQIYHLACPASPVHYQHNAIKTIKCNIMGTMNVCGLAKRIGARLLLASTSEVYGDPDVHPQPEEYFGNVNCIGPRSCYDEGKRTAETLCMDYHRQHGVDIRIIRIFNTYGPRMIFNDGRVVSNFIVQALRNDPITVYGDGSQSRSFCYVSDLVEGIYRMMNQTETIGPINLGNPGEYTMKELAEEVIKCLPSTNSSLEYRPLPQDDPRRRKPDITKAKKFLNWEPTVSLQAGLAKTVDDFSTRAKRNPAELVCSHQKGAQVKAPSPVSTIST